MLIADKYLLTLKEINDWATVSEWALKFSLMFPDLLEKANEEARNQKQNTTGLREIAARISSTISRGAFNGRIELDESERPRRAKYLPEESLDEYVQNEVETDLEPLTRLQRKRTDYDQLSTNDKYRIDEFESIASQLRTFVNIDFELDHSSALLNSTNPGSHHPDNLQLLVKSHNRIKSSTNWERFTIEEQISYIEATISLQRLIAKRINLNIDDAVIKSIITRLKLIY